MTIPSKNDGNEVSFAGINFHEGRSKFDLFDALESVRKNVLGGFAALEKGRWGHHKSQATTEKKRDKNLDMYVANIKPILCANR